MAPSSMDPRLTKKLFFIHQKILRVKEDMSSILTLGQKSQNASALKQLLHVQGATKDHKWSLLELSGLISLHRKVQWSNLPRMAMVVFPYLQDQPSAVLSGRFSIRKIPIFLVPPVCMKNHWQLPKLFPNNDRLSILSRWIFITWRSRKYGSRYWIRIGCFEPQRLVSNWICWKSSIE